MAKSRQVAKEKPKWLLKIDAGNAKAANQAFEAFCQFVSAKIDFEIAIESINGKYGSKFTPQDMFTITPDQEDEVIDVLEGVDDDESDD